MIKKHDELEVTIKSIEFPDKGIGYIDDNKIIMRGAIIGQTWWARVFKVKKGVHVKGLELLTPSPIEIASECLAFGACGGCTYQNISYANELLHKQNMVSNLFKESQISGFEFYDIVPSETPYAYRNKMEYTFGDEEKGGNLCLGMRKKYTYYETVNVEECLITHADFGKILNTAIEFFKATDETFFHRLKMTGTLRNMIVRRTHFTNEILINIVTTSFIKADLSQFVQAMLGTKLEGEIKGIMHTICDTSADAVNADIVETLYGQAFFTEKLLGLNFEISTFSFFQTNSKGAESLYSTVIEFAKDQNDKVIFDLYCGTGTIAQIVSSSAKRVIGIEIVAEAVDSANKNALLNNITNCEFIAGDVFKVIDDLNIAPDTIILDPPREGINVKAIPKIIAFNAKTIVYISCKPTSLMDDLKLFIAGGYRVEKVRCHDMFPRTANLETVVLLKKCKR